MCRLGQIIPPVLYARSEWKHKTKQNKTSVRLILTNFKHRSPFDVISQQSTELERSESTFSKAPLKTGLWEMVEVYEGQWKVAAEFCCFLGSSVPTPPLSALVVALFNFSHLIGVQCCLLVFLIHISWGANDADHHSGSYLKSIHLIWWGVCSNIYLLFYCCCCYCFSK